MGCVCIFAGSKRFGNQTTHTMNAYKLTFDNGSKFTSTTEWLAETESKVVAYINKNGLTFCRITCPNGLVRTVRKTGGWHPIHNGFIFN
jgi:hypothetical protein